MGESQQVKRGMLPSSPRRWAGHEMKPAVQSKSKELTALPKYGYYSNDSFNNNPQLTYTYLKY